MNDLTRRDFLKLTGLLSLGAAAPSFMKGAQAIRRAPSNKKNVLVIIFDALSAYHLSLHGYERETTPNIARLVERAVVYHNHYSGGSYTTPATASLFTGVYPWKHRALKFYSTLSEEYATKTMFHAFDNYYRIAYSHNPLANALLDQAASSIEEYIPQERFFLTSEAGIHSLFHNDNDIATVGWSRDAKKPEGSFYSLFFSELYQGYLRNKIAKYTPFYPLGMPSVEEVNYFVLEDAMDGLGDRLIELPRPFLGYIHLMPPHQSYNTHIDFHNFFANDNVTRPFKPKDVFVRHNGMEHQDLMRRSREYDEFILYVDREFGKFMERMEAAGLLEDTWIILTSDHGDLFERGVMGHMTEILYQPLIRIPLIIFEPGRKTRTDIYTKTSAVDVLPTLLRVTGRKQPEWTDGVILPPYSSKTIDPERRFYFMQSKETLRDSPFKEGTFILVREQYKLMYLFGYEKLGGQERVELYDVEQDREEMNNLYPANKNIGKTMLDELKAKIDEMNRPYL